MSYKWCVVPACTNTTIKTPEKLFVCLPKNLKMRKKWLRLASKSTGLSSNSDLFICEDHLDMDNDMANYDQYKIGLSDMAYGVLLSKFNCQQGSQEIPPTANMQEYVISKPHVATDMNAKVCCAVPQCVNTSQRTANKLFVRVRPKKTIRDKWFNLARRDPTAVGLNSSMSFCEDHFDLPNDMENFMEYHVMGFVAQVRMKPGCIPTKFECQSDRRKPTSNSTERPYYTKETTVKKQRKIFIEECQYDLEERSTKLLELGESLSGSSENASSNSKSLAKCKASPQSELQSSSEITVKEFLEFLKTAYQVQESLEGILMASGMTEAIDWLKLKESQFIRRNETASQTSSSANLNKELSVTDGMSKKAPSTSAKSSDISDLKLSKSQPDFLVKSNEVLMAKLNEVLSEGLLDPILPLLPMMATPPYMPTRKSSMSKTSDKSLASVNNSNTSLVEKNLKKKSNEEVVKPPLEKTSSQVEIHVCDEVKNMKKDFYCNQKLLVEKMGYFAEVTSGQKLEDMDISVHCDVGIFEWLMKWVQKELLLEEDWPKLDSQNVIPIVVSAAFLQMEPLLEECLRFGHENMNEILRTSTNLSCLNDQILNRLAAMYTNTELDSVRDKKDKLQSKLFTKLIVSLVEPEPECLRGHWSSLARTYRCEKCQQLIEPSVTFRIPCIPPCMRLKFDGSILSYHVRDPRWNINEYIEKLYKQLKSWRKVYWRLWGNAHFLYCTTCKRFFPANQLGWCLFHPDAPQFFTLDAQKAPLPVGRYPCCGDRAYRFQLLSNFRGCKFKDHSVCTKSLKDSAVLNLLLSYRHLVAEEPPELLFPERLTRLVARDVSTSDKLICKEIFWWDGLQIIPPRPKLGLLNMFSERGKSTDVDSRGHSTDDESHEDSSNSNRTSTSGSSEESRPRSPRPVKKKRKKRRQCRLWQVHLSARSNQDTQRSYEEKALKQMAVLLNKKCTPSIDSSIKHKYGKLVHKNTNPLGGVWVRLESEWREQNVNTQQKMTRQLFTAKGRPQRVGRFP